MSLVNKNKLRYSRGFSLIELMISIVLGLLVLIGVSAVYISAKQSFRFQEASGRLQEDANFALDVISKDLRMSAFAGCKGISAEAGPTYYPINSLVTTSQAITGPNPMGTVISVTDTNYALVALKPLSPQNFIRGFDSLKNEMFASGSIPAAAGGDSLYLARGGNNSVSLKKLVASAEDFFTVESDAFNWGSATANNGFYTMIVSDCSKSHVFSGKIAGGGTQINYADSSNSTPYLGGFKYDVDSIVMPLEWSYYYLSTRTGASTPSLYRVMYDGNLRKSPEELVSNIEMIKFQYGENTANDPATGSPTLQADVWRTTAASVTDWSRVVAVRVGLMVVSETADSNADVNAAKTLLGQSYTIPVGASLNRQRKEFSTTIVLRNRVAAR